MPKIKTSVLVANLNDDVQPLKGKSHKRHSVFMITLNTNKRFGPYEEGRVEYANKMESVLKDMFRDDKIEQYIIIKRPEDSWENNVDKVSVDVIVERAPKTGCMHTHIGLHLWHRTLTALNSETVKNAFCDGMDLESCYMSVKILSTATFNLKDYIHKNLSD